MTPETARKSLAALGGEPDERFDAIEAALALAAADDPGSPVGQAREIFAELAEAAMRLLADNPDAARGAAVARAGLVSAVLASHGISGDRDSYDDPANANLARVLVRRRGLPVALGLIWIGIARRLGWPLAGIDFPGHFLLGIQGHAQALLLDPFDSGRVLDPPGLRALKQRLAGGEATLAPRDLSAMTDRAVVLRLANNLRVRRLEADALEPALSISQDMLRLAPREAGLMLAAGELALRVGQPRAAILHLQAFLAEAPPPADARVASALLDKARQSLN
jgi:regulator of sirC expression with transglutaminase-like and TPR domain